MKKRFVSLILCLGVCLSLMTTTAFAAGFSDVKSTAYYAKPVAWAVSQNITGGTTATTFSPDNTCTRAHIITFLWRAAGSPEPWLDYNPFSDVAEDAYYYKAAVWAMTSGILPISGAYFEPATPCTRLAALEYIWRYAGSPAAEKVAFTDLPSNAESATAISWGVRYGVTGGKTATTFVPKETCTRAQIVTFLHRYFVEPIEKKEPTPAKPSTPASDMKLDPLPPVDYTKQPDWYGSLTPAAGMSNARLVAEYQQIQKVINERREKDIYMSDGPYSRELDLWSVLKRRVDVVKRYDRQLRDGDVSDTTKREYNDLIAAYGDADILRTMIDKV